MLSTHSQKKGVYDLGRSIWENLELDIQFQGQFAVRYLAQGHFGMWSEADIKPLTFSLEDDLLYLLSHNWLP